VKTQRLPKSSEIYTFQTTFSVKNSKPLRNAVKKANIKVGKPPLHPLCEFLRLDPKVSRLD